MADYNPDLFPLSKIKSYKGSRRLLREKVLQLICASRIAETPFELNFSHIFFRIFNVEDDFEEQHYDKLLTPDEIIEVEADIPIIWHDDEIEFGKNLYFKAVDCISMVDSMIEEYVKNWELERLASIDRCLIYIAVAELLYFPDIPPKVSINEAIDISKKYSTEKSSLFINGVLDTVLENFKKEGRLNKSGRGLQNK